MHSHTAKVALLWILFALATLGTYILSHRIELRSENAAAVFSSHSSSAEVALFVGKAQPASIVANVGDEIVFKVMDDSKHDISEERSQRKEARLVSGEIGRDESYSLVFQSKGVFSFYDRLNQDIHVTVTIQ